MTRLKSLETKLEGWFKPAADLPASYRESLVKVWPYLALVLGVLQLWAAWGLYGLMRAANRVYEYADTRSVYYGDQPLGMSGFQEIVISLCILTLIFNGVILLMAYAPLAKRQRSGWDLLFLATLANAAYGLIAVFIAGRGLGNLLFSLAASGVSLYLLFQIKDRYSGKVVAALKPLEDKTGGRKVS